MALVATPLALGAQAAKKSLVIASVTDAKSGQPLENAEVTVSDANITARTDWIGEARIPNVTPGQHKFEIRHAGYAPLDVDLLVEGDSTGPVFRLVSAAAPAANGPPSLAPVNVAGDASSSYLAEFEKRRSQGRGKYLTAADLDAKQNRSLVSVLANAFSGVMSTPDPSRPGHNALTTRRSRPRLDGAGSDSHCGIDMYLDGSRYMDDLESIHPTELAGVEYYSIESAPPEYRRPTDNCGVLLLWSRR